MTALTRRAKANTSLNVKEAHEENPMDVENLMQLVRTLKASQIRRQLRDDEQHNTDRYYSVYNFFRLAKEKAP